MRERKHLSTDADSSTNAIGGWTKNTQKPHFFWQAEKITKNAKTQKRLEIWPLIHWETRFPLFLLDKEYPKTHFFF